MKRYKSIDLFAGIGGIRLGFEKAFDKKIKTVFVSEWDKNAQKTYRENYKDNFEISGDITKIAEKAIPEFDICLAGFPCQAFSLAGKRKGFEDDYKGVCRGTLFMDVARICEEHNPKVIFCENVKGLVMHDKGRTLHVIKKTFENLGYKVYSKVLNSKDFGVPQNRERIYIVAFRNDIDSSTFEFPEPTNSNMKIKDIIEEHPVSVKYYLSTAYLETLIEHKARHAAKGNGFGYEIRSMDGIAGAIVCGGMGRERNLIIDNRLSDFTPITHIKGTVNKKGIRKMTPREWARLQGFPDSFRLSLADTHLYKQLGNSVTVTVIEEIAKKIKKVLEKSEKKIKEINIGTNSEMKEVLIMPEITGNKGEWSEIYVLLRLLADGKIYAADENVNKIDSIYFPVLKIIREEKALEKYEYTICENNKIDIYLNNKLIKEVSAKKFSEEAKYLYNEIRIGGNRAFSIEHTEEFMKDIYCRKLAAPSIDKTDITMQIHDIQTGYTPVCGFSIKSELGSAPTLINASKATNFIFEVKGLSDETIESINSIQSKSKIKDRMERIFSESKSISFIKTNSQVFESNLMMIDSRFNELMAFALVYHYCENLNSCEDVIIRLEQENPMNFPQRNFYRYKFKKFLCAAALGMTPSTVWDGIDEANGGYIIVTSIGDVLAYHIYNRNFFEEYLLRQTRFERGSTSRHEFAHLYKENGKIYLNLNLQIRFK